MITYLIRYSKTYPREIEIISEVTEGFTDGIRIMMIKSNRMDDL